MLKLTWYLLLTSNIVVSAYSANKCTRKISEGCSNRYEPTPREVNRARIFIQRKFLRESVPPPQTKPCRKLHVRRNFKCMSHTERLRVIRVFKRLYANGVMWEMAEIHAKCFPAWHKSVEGVLGHRTMTTILEKKMREIDPNITLPYWVSTEDCSRPHESLIWKYFGTAGTEATDWCLTDSPFTKQTKDRCIKRQWEPDNTLPPWHSPLLELVAVSSNIPMGPMFFFLLGQHFHFHIKIGGLHGHHSSYWAAYDPIFYLMMPYYMDIQLVKWQLSQPQNLIPKSSYNRFWRFDQITHTPIQTNILEDTFCYFNTSVLESWQFGFGEHCWIHDVTVQAINQQINNVSTDAVQRFKRTLPNTLRTLIRPLLRDLTPLQSSGFELPDPSECNPKCRPCPVPRSYFSDEIGRRTMRNFRDDWNFNLFWPTLVSEGFLRLLVRFLNLSGYCSPFCGQPDDISEDVSDDIRRNTTTLFRERLMTFKQITVLDKMEKIIVNFIKFALHFSKNFKFKQDLPSMF